MSKDNTEEELCATVLIVLLALLNSAPVPNVFVRIKASLATTNGL